MTGGRRNSKRRGCWLGTEHKVTSWPRPAGQDCPPRTRAHWEDVHSAGGDRRHLPHCPKTNPLSTWENFLFCESSEERSHPVHTTEVSEPLSPRIMTKAPCASCLMTHQGQPRPRLFARPAFPASQWAASPRVCFCSLHTKDPYLALKSVMPFTPSPDHFPTQKLQIHRATLSRDALYPTPQIMDHQPLPQRLGCLDPLPPGQSFWPWRALI